MRFLAARCLLALSAYGTLRAEEAQKKSEPVDLVTEKLVNRRVLVLDFYYPQKEGSMSFLEISIPEAFIEPLQKTEKFEVLNRQIWNKILELKMFTKDDIFDDVKAVEIGRALDADIVVIGKFVIFDGKVEIQGKAIEVSSGQIRVSRTELSRADSSIFNAIKALALAMSDEMAKKLPPLPQRVIYSDRLRQKEKPDEKLPEPAKNSAAITLSSMLWRTAALPGWGHVYANQSRGWIYFGLFAGTGGAFVWSHFNYQSKESAYFEATSDFDAKYDAANSARKVRGYVSYAFLGVLIAVWTDMLISGPGQARSSALVSWDIYGDLSGANGIKWSLRF